MRCEPADADWEYLSMATFVGESGAQWTYDESARLGDKSGFGEVFLGADSHSEPVAVKRIRLVGGSEADRRLREREVEIGQVIARTAGKHLVLSHDVGRVGDDLLLVMPLAEKSLRLAIEEGLGKSEGLQAVRDVVEGLVELAAVAVLHRDLKPENVLLSDGQWQLADFGIARSLAETTGTYTFRGAGTMPYMAPELWNNQPATVKTDLYAFGVLAYEVLTGSRPFDGREEATLRQQHLYVAANPPAGVTAGVARLVLRLLSKDPARRPQDARSVAETLDAFLKRLTVDQQALQEAALAAQRRRAIEEVAHAQKVTTAQAEEDLTIQAIADLESMMEDAADLARDALPEAELRYDGGQWHLIWDDARVTVVPWPRRSSSAPFDQDPLVTAGAVYLGPGKSHPAANVVCEIQEGRLGWWLYRFTANGFVGANYKFGPLDRPHGFEVQTFSDQRSYMGTSVIHVWQLAREALTAEGVVRLLQESITACE